MYQGNKVVASIAGQTEFQKPIQDACIKNKLNASFKGDLLTIKMPPITTSDYQKTYARAEKTVQNLQGKTTALVDSQLVHIQNNLRNLNEDESGIFDPSIEAIRSLLASFKLHLTLYDIKMHTKLNHRLKEKRTLLLGKK